jgi:hypothetical protein
MPPPEVRNGPRAAKPESRQQNAAAAEQVNDGLSLTPRGHAADPVAVIDAHGLWPWLVLAYQRGWDDCLDDLADKVGGRIMPARPTELEIRRWGPGGRAHFADPRPGDFRGRGGEAA